MCVGGECSLRYPAFKACMCTSVVRPGLQYFSTLSHKRYDIREKRFEHKIVLLIFCTVFFFSETFLIL